MAKKAQSSEKKHKNTQPKALSNPSSTGGGGVTYEGRVQASYLLAMYAGWGTPVMPESKITELVYQGKIQGYETDDLICTLVDQAGAQRKALIQIKRTVSAIASNPAFKETISAAWFDFKNSTLFAKRADRLVLVFDADGDSNMQGAVTIAESARTSLSGAEFARKVAAENFSSEKRRNALRAVVGFLTDILEGPIDQDELHQFMQHLWFISHHLSTENTSEFAGILNQIKILLGSDLAPNPIGIWAELTGACSRLNGLAASLSYDNLDAQISSRLAQGFKRHRESGASSIEISVLSEPITPKVIGDLTTPGIARMEVSVAATDATAVKSATPIESLLPSGRDSSVNKVISAQLDAINKKLTEGRYKDAMENIIVLGSDLGPFDSHQKARWYLQRGVAHWHLEETEQAANDFILASEITSDDDKVAAARIRGYLLQENLPLALQAAMGANERFPQSLHVWVASANASMADGRSIDLKDVPPAHRSHAGALHIVSWSHLQAKEWQTAVDFAVRAIQADDANFFTRHAALIVGLDSVIHDKVAATFRLLTKTDRENLQAVASAFEPRAERLWSSQAVGTVPQAATNLALIFLLLQEPNRALEVVQEAAFHGVSAPQLKRVELEALSLSDQVAQALVKGREYLADLDEPALVGLAQLGGQQADLALIDEIIGAANKIEFSNPAGKDALKAVRLIAHWSHRDKAQVLAELKISFNAETTGLPVAVAATRIFFAADEEFRTQQALARVESLAKQSARPEEKLLLAELLFDIKKYEAAIPYYRDVLPDGQHSELHNKLLCCYMKAGRLKAAKRLLESFPIGWAEDDDARSLAIELGQAAGDWPMLATLTDAQLRRAPKHVSSWLFKLACLVRTAALSDVQAFLNNATIDLEGKVQQIGKLAAFELRYGLKEKGMRRLYRMRRLQQQNADSASEMVIAIVGAGSGLPYLLNQPKTVVIGSAFVIADENNVERNLAIDPEEFPQLPETDEFKNPSNFETAQFLGAKIGEIVNVPIGLGRSRPYRIVSILSSYRRLLDLSHLAINRSLKPNSKLASFSMPETADGPDISALLEQLRKQSEHASRTLETYDKHPITIGMLARMLGKNSIDIVRGWDHSKPLYVCTGTAEERSRAAALFKDDSAGFVIDSATLAELVLIEGVEALAVLKRLFVTAATVDAVKGKLEVDAALPSSATMFEKDGKYYFTEYSESDKKRDSDFLQKMSDAIDHYCEVAPAYGPEIEGAELEKIQDIVSEEEHAMLLLAAEQGLHLISTDARLNLIGSFLHIQAVWPQALLGAAVEANVIPQYDYSLAVARLLISGRSFTAVTALDFLAICQQNDQLLQYAVSKMKRYLAADSIEYQGAYVVTQNFIGLLIAREEQLGVVGEFMAHLVDGLSRHRHAPPTKVLFEQLLFHVSEIITNRTLYDSYTSVRRGYDEAERAAIVAVGSYYGKVLAWSKEAFLERKIYVNVLMIGTEPVLRYDLDGDEEQNAVLELIAPSSPVSELKIEGDDAFHPSSE